jgi:hypothetical protein
MFHITSSLVGGLAALTAWALVPSLSPDNAAQGTEHVERAMKGDRLATSPITGPARTVSTVEVIGIQNAAIVYRDRDGRILFQTDPVSNVTLVTKGLVLPQLTVRETTRSTPTAIEAPHAPQPPQAGPAIPIGCEPLASPIAAPRLSHLAGRCLS